jgi:hypothetical protein
MKPNAGGADFRNVSLSYTIPRAAADGVTFLRVASGNAVVDNTTQFDIAYESGRPDIDVGEGFILLDAAGGGLNSAGFTQLKAQTPSGDTFTIEIPPDDQDRIWAVLASLSPTGPAYERLKAYAESRAASLAFVNQGLDFMINRGFGSALAATAGPGFRFGAFGGVGGGRSRYNTGSHVDVEGVTLPAGLGIGADIPYGRLTLGAFFEGGWGNYTSYNSFGNAASVKGGGNTNYYGGGILGRYDLRTGPLSGLHFDASARMGRTDTEFRTDDIQYNGTSARFDTAVLYYSLHGGIGYVLPSPGTDDTGALDLSAHGLWTRMEGAGLTVYQDSVRFNDADSLRTRLGGRFSYAVNACVAPYIGAYWEHEFDGRLRASVNGNRLASPSLGGNTGVGEFGLTLRPSSSLPLSLDISAQGYTGKREGVTGSVQVKFEF